MSEVATRRLRRTLRNRKEVVDVCCLAIMLNMILN
jgi:hypothetical protein